MREDLQCCILEEGKKWCEELLDVKAFCVPREQLAEFSLGDRLPSTCSRMMRPCAYGAVAYLRPKDRSDSVQVQQLISKARVALLKPVTLPRIEFIATLLGARLTRLLLETLPFTRVDYFCWMDFQFAWLGFDLQQLNGNHLFTIVSLK